MRPIIDEDLRAALRVEAAHRGISATRYINQAVRQRVEADRSRREVEATKREHGMGGVATQDAP